MGDARLSSIDAARAWLDEFERVALATVVSAWGSAPVPVGGQLAVAPGDRFQGSVSGGCVEAEVIFEAANVIATGRPKLLAFGVSDEAAWRAGLTCGGKIEVFVDALDCVQGAAFLDALRAARAQRKPVVVRTNLTDGARSLFEGAAATDPDVAACLKSGKSQILDAPDGRIFLQAVTPAVHVIIVGATHIGQALADLALRVGWKATVVDPRSAFAAEERFQNVAFRAEWPEPALASLGLDEGTAVVALTHAGHIDDEALAAALRSKCFYVGALGSKKTHAARVERLRASGFMETDIARVRGPVGLPIGALGPEEIAVSIIAQIVKDRRGA